MHKHVLIKNSFGHKMPKTSNRIYSFQVYINRILSVGNGNKMDISIYADYINIPCLSSSIYSWNESRNCNCCEPSGRSHNRVATLGVNPRTGKKSALGPLSRRAPDNGVLWGTVSQSKYNTRYNNKCSYINNLNME